MRRSTNVELLASTTEKLIRPFEAMALFLQAANLFSSAVNDRYSALGVRVVVVLGVLHLALAGLVLPHRGPLTRGRTWTAAWIAMIFVVQLLLARLLAPGDFAAYGTGVPMGNYALIPLGVFAFYPWGRHRRLIEVGLIVAVVAHPLVILALIHRWQLTGAHVRSVVMYAGWAVVWFLVGKGIAWLCRIAVRLETEALSASYTATLGDLHTHVESAIEEIEAGNDAREVAHRLRLLTAARRGQLLLRAGNVGAADLFKNAIRACGDRLRLVSGPQLGGLTVPREHAILLEQGLADLLKNVVVHGSGSAEVGFTMTDSDMTLDVRDFGPGLEPSRLDVSGSSLHQLRTTLRERGGDLRVLPPPPGGGAAVRVTVPIWSRR
ncbi:ATP-binding protein [Longispora sp. NPDC051575]|uniref:ATP-binding protein n=1 Tax=Longispora sp. NPDC051575 TaxID=3154943 RepID=UPI00342793BC